MPYSTFYDENIYQTIKTVLFYIYLITFFYLNVACLENLCFFLFKNEKKYLKKIFFLWYFK